MNYEREMQITKDWIRFNEIYGKDPKKWGKIWDARNENMLIWMLIHKVGNKDNCQHHFLEHHIELLGDMAECKECGILRRNVK